MDFSSIIQNINSLQSELKNACLTIIEKDIVKTKLCDLYMIVAETEQQQFQSLITDPQPSEIQKNNSDDLSLSNNKNCHSQRPIFANMDYKTLSDVFLEKAPVKPFQEDNSLFNKMSQAKITDLKKNIAMNERFIFVKELFKNDFEAYNEAINKLNQSEHSDHAMQLLNVIKNKYEWNEENTVVQHFIALIKRKYIG